MDKTDFQDDEQAVSAKKKRNEELTEKQMERWRKGQKFDRSDRFWAEKSLFGTPVREWAVAQYDSREDLKELNETQKDISKRIGILLKKQREVRKKRKLFYKIEVGGFLGTITSWAFIAWQKVPHTVATVASGVTGAVILVAAAVAAHYQKKEDKIGHQVGAQKDLRRRYAYHAQNEYQELKRVQRTIVEALQKARQARADGKPLGKGAEEEPKLDGKQALALVRKGVAELVRESREQENIALNTRYFGGVDRELCTTDAGMRSATDEWELQDRTQRILKQHGLVLTWKATPQMRERVFSRARRILGPAPQEG